MELALRRGLPPGLMMRLLASIADFVRCNPDFLTAPKLMSRYRDEAPQSILLIFTERGRVGAGILLTAGGNSGYTASILPVGGYDYGDYEELSEWIEGMPEELLGSRGLPDAAARIDARAFDIVREDLSQNRAEDPLYVCCRSLLRALRLGLIDMDPAPFQFDVFSKITAEDILYRFRERFGFHVRSMKNKTMS
ncbi:MAG: hypothetical protein ABIH66_04530 [bacterium]